LNEIFFLEQSAQKQEIVVNETQFGQFIQQFQIITAASNTIFLRNEIIKTA